MTFFQLDLRLAELHYPIVRQNVLSVVCNVEVRLAKLPYEWILRIYSIDYIESIELILHCIVVNTVRKALFAL